MKFSEVGHSLSLGSAFLCVDFILGGWEVVCGAHASHGGRGSTVQRELLFLRIPA